MTDISVKVSVLTLEQLLKQPFWSQYTLENIFEFSNNGEFGLYCKFSNEAAYLKRKTYHSIIKKLKSELNQSWLKDPANKSERDQHLQLQQKLFKFIKNNKFLLKNKDGYVRLATAIEVEILSFCSEGSVACFLNQSGIDGQEFNNYFGFVFLKPDYQKLKRCIISPAYHFRQRITPKDVVVFTDQIEAFEQKICKALKNAHGIKMSNKRHEKNRQVKEKILTAYIEGQPWTSIAEAARKLGKKFNRSHRTVEGYIYEFNEASTS